MTGDPWLHSDIDGHFFIKQVEAYGFFLHSEEHKFEVVGAGKEAVALMNCISLNYIK